MPSLSPHLARLARNLDVWLLDRGFSSKTLRAIALYEIAACAAVLGASFVLLAVPWTRAIGLWLFWFGLGAAAGAANYIMLILSGRRLIRAAMSGQGDASRRGIPADVAGIMLKLLITAILFCVAAAVFHASVIALLAGYTLPVAIMLTLGIIYAQRGSE